MIEDYRKQYYNLLAKIGEITLINSMNDDKKKNLMEEAHKMYTILSSHSSVEKEGGGENGLVERIEESS
tara:strand:- start:114 stop:320 length:207 start_codon:yes stop_codon:yes gene_type:complete